MTTALQVISLILCILVTFDTGYRCGATAERRRFTELLIQSIKDDLEKRGKKE